MYLITSACACLLDWCFWGMLCMPLLLTMSSIFTTDGMIRKQHWAFSKRHESDCVCRKWACLAASLAGANPVFIAMFVTLSGTWFTKGMNIMSQRLLYNPDEGKSSMWRLICVEQTLHEMLCYQKEEYSVKMCLFLDDLFLLSPLVSFLSLFFLNNIKLTPYIIPLPLLFLKVVCYLSE